MVHDQKKQDKADERIVRRLDRIVRALDLGSESDHMDIVDSRTIRAMEKTIRAMRPRYEKRG